MLGQLWSSPASREPISLGCLFRLFVGSFSALVPGGRKALDELPYPTTSTVENELALEGSTTQGILHSSCSPGEKLLGNTKALVDLLSVLYFSIFHDDTKLETQ